MYFTKYPHRANFSFVQFYDPELGQIGAGKRVFEATIESFEPDIYRLKIANRDVWDPRDSLWEPVLPEPSERRRLKANDDFTLSLLGNSGRPLLTGRFGVSGEASIFLFDLPSPARFYGMGQKLFGKMELSGYRTCFWNTDVWGDFHFAQWGSHPSDPPYFSLPYLVVKVEDEFIGLLLDTAHPTFMETPGTDESRVFVEWQRTAPELVLGCMSGEPALWVLHATTLADLTRKFQRLVGTTPTPPAWALGYHQSRWGYADAKDLLQLDAQFDRHKIPCDGLWLDIDYMRGYRIFELGPRHFPDGVAPVAEKLAANGRRIVPAIDPGVKFEPGYRVFDDGVDRDVFCRNAEGAAFVGLVWPGETVFPDFSLARVRDWWAGYVDEFATSGFGGCWLDMNDPSTGPVDPCGMLFDHGTQTHEAHHNDYSLGMQKATHAGFLRARPDERPFILSRSGFTGSSRYAAIWTGDNVSNYFYLKSSIPTCVNMSISGQPFNGPDLGGFGGDVTDDLMLDWTKTAFLFPFLRNHANKGTREKEPYALPAAVMGIVRRYIRLRYKLLPYLYNLFIRQEEEGDPILRPLFYEFDDLGLDAIDDQFMVGPSILQAPFVDEQGTRRPVCLPGTEPWFDASTGEWVQPGLPTVRKKRDTTPLYIRAGSVVPMQPGTPSDNVKEFFKVHLHLFIPPDWSGETSFTYKADDGLTFAYLQEGRSELHLRMVCVDGNVVIATDLRDSSAGAIQPTLVIHGEIRSVRLNGAEVTLKRDSATLTGRALPVQVLEP